MRNPNRPEKTLVHRQEKPDLKTCQGDAKVDGYSKVARRPRSRFNDEIVPKSRADEIDSYAYGMDEY